MSLQFSPRPTNPEPLGVGTGHQYFSKASLKRLPFRGVEVHHAGRCCSPEPAEVEAALRNKPTGNALEYTSWEAPFGEDTSRGVARGNPRSSFRPLQTWLISRDPACADLRHCLENSI